MKQKRQNITVKIILPILPIIIISIVGLLYYINQTSRENIVNAAIVSSEETIRQFKTLRGYYTRNVVSKVNQQTKMKIHFDHKDNPKAIPLPATMIHDLSELLSQNENGIQLKLYSDFPFPNRKDRLLDDFAKEAIQTLNTRKDKANAKIVRTGLLNGEEVVRVGIPDSMVAPACVACHNSHPDTPKNDWALGDMRGVLEVTAPIGNQIASQSDMMKQVLWIGIGATLLILFLISFLVFWIVAKDIRKPLQQVSKYLGDKTQKLLKVSTDLSISSHHLLKNSDEQVSATQQFVSAISEISSMINQTNDFAQQSSDLARQVKLKTEEGGQTMQQMVNSMELIKQANTELKEMETIITEISQKTMVINDIVFKTQLLSFNASIEAARAGEHGKGFAVVAEEVGNLAQTSGKAAEEIRKLLDNSLRQVNQIVESTQEKVGEGQRVTQRALNIFLEITKDIDTITEQLQRIEQASKEQAEGIRLSQDGVNQLDEAMGQSNTISQANQSYSEDLKKLSDRIKQTMAVLDLLVSGHEENKKIRKKKKTIMEQLLEETDNQTDLYLPDASSDEEGNEAEDTMIIDKLANKAIGDERQDEENEELTSESEDFKKLSVVQ